MRSQVKKFATVVASGLIGIAVLAGCSESSQPAGNEVERANVNATVEGLQARQPAHSMEYSPTRDTKNFWIDTWGKDPNKLSYVYMQNNEGKLLGYYVLKGLPVSYCTSLTPPFDIDQNDWGRVVVPRPSVDGTWSGGGNCTTYYGRDASTDAYMEYTVGQGINVLLYDRALPNTPNVPALGDAQVPN